MRYAVLFAAILACAPALRADFTMVHKVTGLKGDEVKIFARESKMRADVPGGVSVVFDAPSGEMISILHEQKTAMKSNLAALPIPPTKDGQKVEAKATGQKEKVGEWEAEIFTWQSDLGQGRLWVARDFPNAKAINDQLAKLQQGPLKAFNSRAMPDTAVLPGVVVKSEAKTGGRTIATTLVSFDEKPVAAEKFEVPKGYTVLDIK